ncbi:MAG: alpha/beta fold hydrolase [Acidimicrobiia bacterium]|nr:alpha/beta fold hydrolase [Acidimicrobiia bacterium]
MTDGGFPLRVVQPSGLPQGRPLYLPGRGSTWVHEAPGPPGAPTLLLLHGWTATGALNWFTAIPTLARRYRVVVIDHRGHGRGIRSSRRFRLADCADDAVAVADRLGIDRFVAVGYSMGGPIAQLTWHRHRERVAGLVLCATASEFAGTSGERVFFSALGGLSVLARATPGRLRSGVGQRMLLGRFEGTELGRWATDEVRRHDHRSVVEAGHAIGRFSSAEWLADIDVPTSVVVTTLDPVVTPARQGHLVATIPGAVAHEVRGDHAVCALGAERFVPVLTSAVDDVVARDRHR